MIDKLPTKLLTEILEWLPISSVCAASQCCKALRTATKPSKLWRTVAIAWDSTWAVAFEEMMRGKTIDWKWELRHRYIYVSSSTVQSKGKSRCRLTYDLSTKRSACHTCWRPFKLCLCDKLPNEKLNNCCARVVILQHPRCQVSIGTARLVKLSLKHVDIVVGTKITNGTAWSPQLQKFVSGASRILLLFPTPTSVAAQTLYRPQRNANLDRERKHQLCACGRPEGHEFDVLIAIDGSWRQAKSIVRNNPVMVHLATQTVKIEGHPLSIFGRLKREPHPQCLSTAESVGAAVAAVMSGNQMEYAPYIHPVLDKLVDLQLEHGGKRTV